MGKKSSDKGGKFERDVAKDLSLWISQGKRKDLLWRSSQSGGRATQALKSGDHLAAQAGDLVAVHEDGMKLTSRFVIECKHRSNMGFYNLAVHHKGPLFDFWNKLCDEAEEFGKHPLMIFKENRKPILAAFCPIGIQAFCTGVEQNALVQVMIPLDMPMWIVKYDELLRLYPRNFV